MPRVINIEIMRLKPTKKTAIVMAFLALVIGCMVTSLPGTQAQYASAEQDRHVFTFSDNLDVGVEVSEEQWAIKYGKDGMELESGETAVKDPVITNTKNDCYMRACIRITDSTGTPYTLEESSVLLNNILGTIWYDSSADAAGDVEGTSSNSLINVNKTYSTYDLYQLSDEGKINQICNKTNFEEPVYNQEMKCFTMNYKGLFKAGEKVTLFNRIVIPTDFSNRALRAQGGYYIVVWPQAIQAAGFSNADSALKNLSNEYVPTKIPGNTNN